ncbi:hypothetical protein LPJ64_003252 [Coemansia asiatica]|uniref:polynucleotide adenylyltransferase n=1 Tax=Coemansia asiatica TaxID=1052880 RepID=A0A9W7XM31_9FUNG|nr:hypothetical protein LPJ64_003252 [Coemansia asiatica]
MGHSRKRAARAATDICVSGIKRFPNARKVASDLISKQEQLVAIKTKYDQIAAVVHAVNKQGVFLKTPFPGTRTLEIKIAANQLQEGVGQTRRRIEDTKDLFGSVVVINRDEQGHPTSLTQPGNAKKLLSNMFNRQSDAARPRYLDPLEWVRGAGSVVWRAEQLVHMENELAELLNEYRPTRHGQAEVDRVMQKIMGMLVSKSRDDSIKLVLFGSRGYSICNDSSDIDAMIISGHTNDDEKKKAVVKRALRDVSTGLRSMKRFHSIVNIPSTRVPIVKFKYSGSISGLQFEGDISCSNAVALQKTRLIKQYVDMDQRVRSVLTVVKKWAKLRLISDSNTLNSYGLVMMALAFLISRRVVPPLQLLLTAQVSSRCWWALDELHRSPSRIKDMYWRPGSVTMPGDPARCLETGAYLPVCEINSSNTYFCQTDAMAHQYYQSPNRSTASQLLFEFFHFFGFSFDPLTQAVSARLGSPALPRACLPHLQAPACQRYLAEPKQWVQGLRLLAIEDPFETSLNCGRNAPAEWVEGLFWEMRRAASILAPDYHDSKHGRLERLFVPPAASIYSEPAVWAPVYRTLMPYVQKGSNKNVLDLAADIQPCSLVNVHEIENAQLQGNGQITPMTAPVVAAAAESQRNAASRQEKPENKQQQHCRNTLRSSPSTAAASIPGVSVKDEQSR